MPSYSNGSIILPILSVDKAGHITKCDSQAFSIKENISLNESNGIYYLYQGETLVGTIVMPEGTVDTNDYILNGSMVSYTEATCPTGLTPETPYLKLLYNNNSFAPIHISLKSL
jgi:hypothetical protein